jgi:hypothetical protein
MGWFSDLFCGKLSPFCEEKKIKIILSQIPFFKKIPITETIIKNLPKVTATNYNVKVV